MIWGMIKSAVKSLGSLGKSGLSQISSIKNVLSTKLDDTLMNVLGDEDLVELVKDEMASNVQSASTGGELDEDLLMRGLESAYTKYAYSAPERINPLQMMQDARTQTVNFK